MRTNNKYIVKSLAPWMMDEILAFSSISKFDLILLRKPKEFHIENLKLLKKKGIDIYIKPHSYKFLLKKFILILKFTFSNILKFKFNYNAVIGFKSLFWFLKLDLKHFSTKSNIHAQFATQAAIVSLLIKEFYSNKPSISFTFHAYDIYYKNSWFNLLVNNCHQAFSISKFNIDYVRSNYVNSNKIMLSRLGVFKNIITKEPKESKKFTIGLISWFVDKKGIHFLLEAIKSMKQDGITEIELILAGDGPLKDSYLRYIEKNELVEMVSYIGKISGKEKENFFNRLDAFILPSIKLKNDQDGIPVVLMEAIAYSLPIISTQVSGIPEICVNKYNGLLIKEKSSLEIVNAIAYLMKNPGKMAQFSKNSFELSNQYDIESNSNNKASLMKWKI